MTDVEPAAAAGPVPGGEAGAEVGQALGQARGALGLSIADVALQLKFAPRQIEAMEAGRFDMLPTGTFARGMVRSYARLLKLDPVPLVERISVSTAAPDNANAVGLQRPIPITDSTRRTNLVYAALSVIFLVIIAAVAIEWQRDQGKSADMKFVAPAPAIPAPEAPVPSAAPLPAPDTPAPSPAVPEAPATVPAPAPSSAPAPAPAAKSTGPSSNAARRIQLRFERDSWVQIRGRGGKLLVSELNRAGTERLVEGNPPFDLVIGNAQHVRVAYGDRPVDLTPHVKVEVARFTLE